ncbi:MAG: SagB/ThcOx family dehydrogenase [Deltaproteobacteria bacterium]|nr:SagB/ThcOx family dehydrogenase [Deltaproteobacteria bacterium]
MVTSARDYHFATSYDRNHMKAHHLDWPNQPTVFKTYEGVEQIPLPEVSQFPETYFWRLNKTKPPSSTDNILNIELVSKIFTLSYSLTAKRRLPGGYEFHYRSVASAGALYPAELYLAARSVEGLESGVYHYGIYRRTLTPLRRGDPWQAVEKATLESEVEKASAWFFVTGIFFRSAWKYRARAFRYVLLDAGHLLENLVLALKAFNLFFSIHYDFRDDEVAELLGLDQKKEGCFACVTVHGKSAAVFPGGEVKKLPETFLQASCVSNREVTYDEILSCYQAGIQPIERKKTNTDLIQSLGVAPESWKNLPGCKPKKTEMKYPEVIFRRRSKRNFVNQELGLDKFLHLLNLVADALEQNFVPGHPGSWPLACGFLTGNIEDTLSGFYLLDPLNRRIGLVGKGTLVHKMASVCLDQEWLGNASLHFLLMTNLQEIDQTWGPRGYRYAMLAAGRIGQSIYLGATELGLGCCGIGALYDEEARQLLGLNKESALLYLVAAGPVKRL